MERQAARRAVSAAKRATGSHYTDSSQDKSSKTLGKGRSPAGLCAEFFLLLFIFPAL
jgi:hypothetical protein